MKHTAKITALILALLMLSAAFVACSDTTDQPGSVTTAAVESNNDTEPGVTTDGNLDEKGFLKDDLPDDLNFDSDVNFLVWSDVENPEFFADTDAGEPIALAIDRRNSIVEKRLGVTLKFQELPGNYGNRASFAAAAEAQTISGTGPDIIAAYSLTIAGIVNQGLCGNLNAIDHIDFSKPWWPERLVEESLIGDKIYFCSGDLSTNMLHKMHVTFFDRNKAETLGFSADALYEQALDGKWTVDRLIEFAKTGYKDLDGDGIKNIKTDQFGLVLCDNYYDAFFYCADQSIIRRNADGVPCISDDLSSEKSINIAAKVGNFFATDNSAAMVTDFTEPGFMRDGRALSIITRADVAYKVLRFVDGLEYGVLPVPKYDEEQERYCSTLAFPCTLYTMSKSAKTPDMVGAVLEALCSEGYRNITPILFEASMKYRYASDVSTAKVYDIVRSTVTFDLGRIFHDQTGELITEFRNAIRNNNSGYSSSIKSKMKIGVKTLNILLEKLMK